MMPCPGLRRSSGIQAPAAAAAAKLAAAAVATAARLAAGQRARAWGRGLLLSLSLSLLPLCHLQQDVGGVHVPWPINGWQVLAEVQELGDADAVQVLRGKAKQALAGACRVRRGGGRSCR